MSSLIKLDLNPPVRTLRQFGWIAFFVFGALAFTSGSSSGAVEPSQLQATLRWALLGIAVLSGFFSLVAPRVNRLLFVALSVVTYPIGIMVSHVLLACLFYGVIVPVAMLAKLAGRDVLRRAATASTPTYWIDARPPRPSSDYFKQF